MATGIKRKTESSVKAQLDSAKAITTKGVSQTGTRAKSNAKQQATSKAPVKSNAVSKSTTAVPKAIVVTQPAGSKKTVTTPQPKSKPKLAKKVIIEKATVVAKKPNPDVAAKEKHKKPKLVRDSFTMPEAEYALLGEVKKACIAAGIEVKKSQLLRIGLQLLKKTSVANLKTMIAALPPLKAGRPKLN